MIKKVSWIALDWGTTHLRAYGMSDVDTVVVEAQSDDGMGKLAPDEFEAALLKLVADWLPVDDQITVLACGMVGASQGWTEAPYLVAPCAPDVASGLTSVVTQDSRLNVFILPGVSQAQPADVMRGEETQIAGLLASQTAGDVVSTVCLPGTHTKWVSLDNGRIRQFSTFMSGEMFALLGTHSILRHNVGDSSAAWDQAAFLQAAEHSVNSPHTLLSDCFRIRAQGLLDGFSPSEARSRLSGLLIGAELAGAESYWSNQRVALIGDPVLSGLYAAVLANLTVGSLCYDPKTLTLAGICRAYRRYKTATL